ncbi:tRNA (uracil-5-)-methyltransferase homolog A-like [Physella acuta]|uniref:tRNA (uracil-5-)-methyltransferase homolog A-like n=1 Tax=Physella acuta TaxID=109671 RepID=UPI0027DCE09D|nr:tRNA (uracil-5-)-methyltransferase homolog A-like [Physella acuta]
MELQETNKLTKHKLEPDNGDTDDNMKKSKLSEDIIQPDSSLDEAKVEALDPLNYTRAEEFTSEIFKIQIYNLPKFGFSDLKKRLKSSLHLNPHKIKHIDKTLVTYVCFKNASDRDEALKKINGHVWKGKTLEAKIAAPVADPYLQKRLQEKGNGASKNNNASNIIEENLPLSAEEAEKRLRANVIPLWNVDYPQQLQMKTDKIKNVLSRVPKNSFVKHMFKDRWKNGGMACELLQIVPSPIITEYRNKNEFTIGYGSDAKTRMVGFRYGMYKDGTTSVGDCTNLGIVMPAAIPVIKSFTEFVSQSAYLPFHQQSGTGNWQTLTVRTLRTGDVMAMIDFFPRKLDQSEIAKAKESVKDFFTTGPGKNTNFKSLYFRVAGNKGQKVKDGLELLRGEPHVYETLLDMKFRISPEAFFQVNTLATEKLYELIAEWSCVSLKTTVLDICCGTGTIGLSMAKRVKSVIGVEMCEQAVEDAQANATINGITNATFHCSKVEDVISKIISSLLSSTETVEDIVAVVDPPRAGLHKDVIKSLRKCKEIQRLVYVSCNPESALDNFIDLIRPETGRHKGLPYTMVKAVPVDLFPGTNHCELIILFTHHTEESSSQNMASTEGCEQQTASSLCVQTESLPPSKQVESLPPSEPVESTTEEISDKNCNSDVKVDECVEEHNELPLTSAPDKTDDHPD